MTTEHEINEMVIGDRITYTVPERGGYTGSFGRLLKVNNKTVLLRDENKFSPQQVRVDKTLLRKVIRFS